MNEASTDTRDANDRRRDGEPALADGRVIEPPAADDVFSAHWKTLGEWGSDWFSAAPPPRQWLLERDDIETNGHTRQGVLALGKVGLLIAAGGVGKTMALTQLAIAVAVGGKWLGTFHAPSSGGRVLLALAEEDAEEIRRRVYNAACCMQLTDVQRKLASERIVALPLAGTSVALTESDGKNTVESTTLTALRTRLQNSGEWSLIILDPLSRFAVGAETDNAAATRFIEAAESLTKSPGTPTVLIAHHTNKISRADEDNDSVADSRGVSGLTDGVRWAARLTRLDDNVARIAVRKSNYALYGAPVMLVRDQQYSGALRAERGDERLAREAAQAKAKAATKQKPRANGRTASAESTLLDDDAF